MAGNDYWRTMEQIKTTPDYLKSTRWWFLFTSALRKNQLQLVENNTNDHRNQTDYRTMLKYIKKSENSHSTWLQKSVSHSSSP